MDKHVIQSLINIDDTFRNITDIELLAGGRQHLSWRIKRDQDYFVVKKLSPNCFLGNRNIHHYETTESFASTLAEQLPFVMSALQFKEGQYVNEIQGEYYVIYPHYQGYPLHNTPSNLRCAKMGRSLAQIHSSALTRNFSHLGKNDLLKEIKLEQKLDRALKLSMDLSKEEFQTLSACYEQYRIKEAIAQDDMIVSHRDINMQNVLWSDENFVIIDWESAGLIHPGVELLGMALNFSGIESACVNWECFDSTVDAYAQVTDLPAVDNNLFFHYFSTWFAWLNYILDSNIMHTLSNEELAREFEITVRAIHCAYLYRDRIIRCFN